METQEPKNILEDIDLAELYHENSKLRKIDQEHFNWISFISMSPTLREIMLRPFKLYRGKPIIVLPEITQFSKSKLSFDDAVLMRKSCRSFQDGITLIQLGKILYYGYGITRTMQVEGSSMKIRFRAVPSAGALYPLEVYIFALNVIDIKPGLYHYNARDNSLELLQEKDFREILERITLSKSILKGAACLIVLSAIFARARLKYRKQAYRFVLFEAGHVSQNMMLAATSLELGTVAIGGFLDDEINCIIDINGINESVLYLLACGKPVDEENPVLD